MDEVTAVATIDPQVGEKELLSLTMQPFVERQWCLKSSRCVEHVLPDEHSILGDS